MNNDLLESEIVNKLDQYLDKVVNDLKESLIENLEKGVAESKFLALTEGMNSVIETAGLKIFEDIGVRSKESIKSELSREYFDEINDLNNEIFEKNSEVEELESTISYLTEEIEKLKLSNLVERNISDFSIFEKEEIREIITRKNLSEEFDVLEEIENYKHKNKFKYSNDIVEDIYYEPSYSDDYEDTLLEETIESSYSENHLY